MHNEQCIEYFLTNELVSSSFKNILQFLPLERIYLDKHLFEKNEQVLSVFTNFTMGRIKISTVVFSSTNTLVDVLNIL